MPDMPSHAICVYAEPLVRGRRVLVFGDAMAGIGERLLELGARAVQFYDADAARAAGAAEVRGLFVRAMPAGELEGQIGPFDLAVVPELGAVDKTGQLLARVRRLLARGGAALIGGGDVGAAGAIDYYDLYDRAASHFAHVRMIAEQPFRGIAVVALGVDEPEPDVSVETHLAGEPAPPVRFFALASNDDVNLGDYTIVQVPSGQPVPESQEGDFDVDVTRAALAQAQLRASLLEAQIDELRAKAAQAQEARHFADELGRERDRSTALDAALSAADTALVAMRARASAAEEAALTREAQLAEALAELAVSRDLARDRDVEASRVANAEARATAVVAEVARASEEHAAELSRLEGSLRERAGVVRDLEQEVTRREGIVRELLAILEEAAAPDQVAPRGAPSGSPALDEVIADREELLGRLDDAALELARKESEHAEMTWRVSELEQQVARLEAEQTELTTTLRPPAIAARDAAVVSTSPGDSEDVPALRDELDALRQALAQEHAARMRAESGEELEKARTELARQATLLEQLSRELDARDRARSGPGQGRSVDRSEA